LFHKNCATWHGFKKFKKYKEKQPAREQEKKKEMMVVQTKDHT
jgi:hypothetical protein